jgi:hypothetical protein
LLTKGLWSNITASNIILMAITVATITFMVAIHTILASSSNSLRNKEEQKKSVGNVCPTIKITDPSPESTMPASKITVNGTLFDCGIGIKQLEAFAHKYPFNNVFEFKQANLTTKQKDGWLKWSISLPLNSTGIYRILVHVKDNASNENWNETRVNVPFFTNSTNGSAAIAPLKKIALVIPTFTETAYSPYAFYTFYDKYHSTPPGKAVTTDLHMLSHPIGRNDINPYIPIEIKNLTVLTPEDPDDEKIIFLADHLRKIRPNNALLTIIRDEDIHNGYIFNSDNTASTITNHSNSKISSGKNFYDTLVLFHDEYATQSMYNNYKRFVSNGGTIIFVDANVFMAEVNYNKADDSIRFVNGHGWKLNDDGKSATKSVDERWFNENAQWLGSNFLVGDITDNIYFLNNPFNYTHFEENYINNPKDKILIDYGAVLPRNSPYLGSIVASYELSYGKGKMMMTGLYGQKLMNNESFLKMLENWILN